jgi:hypothetical protein
MLFRMLSQKTAPLRSSELQGASMVTRLSKLFAPRTQPVSFVLFLTAQNAAISRARRRHSAGFLHSVRFTGTCSFGASCSPLPSALCRVLGLTEDFGCKGPQATVWLINSWLAFHSFSYLPDSRALALIRRSAQPTGSSEFPVTW